jgi:hypothetical protein
VLLTLLGYTLPLSRLEKDASLSETDYGLLPSFYDGLLEEMPPGARLVDGYEFAYGFKEKKSFVDGYRRIHEEAPLLSKLPDHYRDKVSAGFGLWLDYRQDLSHFSPEEFERALRHALSVSDQYVWVYSELVKLFPSSNRTKSQSKIKSKSKVKSKNVRAYLDAMVRARRGF